MRQSFALIVALVVCLLLAGCNGVSLTTIWKMRKIDPLAIDLAQVRIALRGPDWMAPMFGDMKLLIKTDIWNHDALSYTFRLKKIDAFRDEAALRRDGLASEGLSILEIDPTETGAMREAAENIHAYKKAGYQGATSVALWNRDLSGCTNFRPPEGPVIMDVYLHLDDASGWMPLFEKRDFSGEIGKIEQNGMNCDNDVKSSAAKTKAAPMVGAVKSHTKELHGGVSVQSEK